MSVVSYGQDTSDSRGTTVVAGGSTHTKGSWVELAASTSIDAEWITVQLDGPEIDESYLFDIGVGAAASESVVIANIPLASNVVGLRSVTLPLTIPSGSRVSARMQATAALQEADVSIHLSSESAYGTSASNITLGADTSASLGTVLDPGGTANTKGSWVELASSTSADIDYLLVMIGPNDNAVIGNANSNFLIDIATGAAASETVVIANIPYQHNSFEYHFNTTHAFFLPISSGTRVAARAQSTETDATDRLLDIVVIGCNMTAPSGGFRGSLLRGNTG